MSKYSTIQVIINHFPKLSKNELIEIDDLLDEKYNEYEDINEYLNSFEYKVDDSVVDSLFNRLSKENVL